VTDHISREPANAYLPETGRSALAADRRASRSCKPSRSAANHKSLARESKGCGCALLTWCSGPFIPLATQCKTMAQEFRNDGAQRAHRAQPSSTPLCQRLRAITTRWLGLARNRYRPELHYMRGRGPKWTAKHQGHSW